MRHLLTFLSAIIISLLAGMFGITASARDTVVITGADVSTGLKYWIYDNNGFYLKLTQRLPDQTRGYFEARGFDQDSVEIAATSCIFQTMIKNSASRQGSIMTTELSEWKVVNEGNSKPMLLREYWKKLWLDNNQPQSARIAFEWSLLPGSIRYDANDYNWGMSSYGLAPGSHFDLYFNWRRDGKQFTGEIRDIVCPADEHPPPPVE